MMGKIANSEQQHSDKGDRLYKNIVVGTGTVAGGGALEILNQNINQISGKRAFNAIKTPLPHNADNQKIYEKLKDYGRTKGINFNDQDARMNFNFSTPIFDVPSNTIHFDTKMNRTAALLAHEIGHGVNAKEGLLKGNKRLIAYRASQMASSLNPAVAAGGVTKYILNKKDNPEKAKRTRRNTLLYTGLSATPHLYEEAKATHRGFKLLKQLGHQATKEDKRVMRSALGTYAVPALAPFAAAGTYFAADAIRDKLKEKRRKNEHNGLHQTP